MKALYIRRILWALCLIGAAVLIGFHGGAASFLLFWCLLLLPLVSLIFRQMIRKGLAIRLEVEERHTVRGERLHCQLRLINDSFLYIPEIRIRMSEGKVQFQPEQISFTCSLKSGEEKVFSFDPLCRHCGRAVIGASRIEVPDYFSLMELVYERIERINILPRRQRLDSILIAPPKAEERRKVDRSYLGEHIPDGQWRSYQPGDDLRRVHWKLSARQQELIMKNQVPEPKSELILIPDGRDQLPAGKPGWLAEDSIVEGTLAIADYFLRHSIALTVVPDSQRRISLSQMSAYDQLYQMMARNFFSGKTRPDETMAAYGRLNGPGKYIVLTWEIDEDFIRRLSDGIQKGSDVTLIYLGDSEEAAALARAEKKLAFYQVTAGNDIFSALKGQSERGSVQNLSAEKVSSRKGGAR